MYYKPYLINRIALLHRNIVSERALIVPHLAEWSLPTPEVCGSDPVISEFLKQINLLSTAL